MSMLLTCNWRLNTLRSYESLASWGAKYCYLNKISTKQFSELLNDYLPVVGWERQNLPITTDSSFDFKSLAKLLGEPLAMVRSLKPVPTIFFSKIDLRFRFCRECMSQGYHSYLHQLSWADLCFIHGKPLENSPELSQLVRHQPQDVRLLKLIYNIWFEDQTFWTEAKRSRWNLICETEVRISARRVFNKMSSVESKFNAHFTRYYMFPKVEGDDIKSVVATCFEVFGLSLKGLPLKNTLSVRSENHDFNCSSNTANAILELDQIQLNYLIQSRMGMCFSSNINPNWMVVLKEIFNQLRNGHYRCHKLFFKTCGMFNSDWKALNNSPYSPYNLDFHSHSPCMRLVSIHLLNNLLNPSEPHPLTNLNFLDLSQSNEEMRFLEGLELGRYFTGYINEIINHRGEEEEVPIRFNCWVPTNVLSDVIDRLIIMHLKNWCFILIELEKSKPYMSAQDYFIRNLRHYLPIYAITRTSSGIRVTINNTNTSYSFNDTASKQHFAEVSRRSNKFVDNWNTKISLALAERSARLRWDS